MRIEVLTSLYPSAVHPLEGVFAERRWLGMRARGHEVHVTQPLPWASRWLPLARWRGLARVPRREERGGLEVERPRYWHLPTRSRANAAAFARTGLAVIARRPRPDVVVLDYAWPAAAAAPALAERRIPCVINGRGSDVLAVENEPALADGLAYGLRVAGHWCAVSQDLVRHMDRLGNKVGQGVLIPNGVDSALFFPRPREAARAAVGFAGQGKLVLCCGHLIERKDPLLALEVFARGAGPRDELVFLGQGPLEGAIVEAARERDLAARVHLLGEVSPERLALWYGAADLLLLTSRREGRPNVVLEALASGRAVLATDAGGTSELLGEHAVRLLARTREPADLAERLRALLASPPVPEALARSVRHLTWEASFQALEGCLRAACERTAEVGA
jgi:glycosyltransferase involved in cell wall biosynthesis